MNVWGRDPSYLTRAKLRLDWMAWEPYAVRYVNVSSHLSHWRHDLAFRNKNPCTIKVWPSPKNRLTLFTKAIMDDCWKCIWRRTAIIKSNQNYICTLVSSAIDGVTNYFFSAFSICYWNHRSQCLQTILMTQFPTIRLMVPMNLV